MSEAFLKISEEDDSTVFHSLAAIADILSFMRSCLAPISCEAPKDASFSFRNSEASMV